MFQTARRRLKKPSEILSVARYKIERYGWIKRDFGNQSIGYCTVGAVWVASDQVRGYSLLRLKARWREFQALRYVAKAAGHSLLVLPDWNDRIATKTQVLDAFRHAEKMAKEDGR